jgi:hypothetical protein
MVRSTPSIGLRDGQHEGDAFVNFSWVHTFNSKTLLRESQRAFAYYASVNGNRSDLGLQLPVPKVVHDATNGYGGFGSLIFNVDPSNQLRFVTSLRKDCYQIPYDPNPNDIGNAPIPENGFVPKLSCAFVW